MSVKGNAGDVDVWAVWQIDQRSLPGTITTSAPSGVNWVRLGDRQIWPENLLTDEHVDAAKSAQDFIGAKW